MTTAKMENILYKMTYASLWALALFTFTSFSLTALHHILIFLPGMYFFVKAMRQRSIEPSKNLIFLGLLIVVTMISVIANWSGIENPLKNLFRIKYLILGFLSIFAYRETMVHYFDVKKVRYLINAFLISTSIATLSGLVGAFTGFNPLRFDVSCHEFRTCGMYGMTVTYGYGIYMFLVLVVALIYFRKDLKQCLNQKILIFALIVNIIGAYLSYARGGMLGFIAALLVFIWFKSKRFFMVAATLSIVVLATLAILSKNDSIDFMKRYFTRWNVPTNTFRIYQAQAAFYAFREKPWTGQGFRNFEPNSLRIKKKYDVTLLEQYTDIKAHAHNNYFEFLASSGLFAFLFLILWHFFWFFKNIRSSKPYSQIFAPFIVAVVVTGLFQCTLLDGENMFMIMLIYALSEVGIESIINVKNDNLLA